MRGTPFLYKRPMIVAATLLAISVIVILRGLYVSGEGDMDGFGLIFLGGFIAVAAIVTAAVYAVMQFRFSRALGRPLLAFTSEIKQHSQAVEKTISQIKGANILTVVIVTAFCVLMAILGPLVAEDGYIFSLIALGIVIFTAISALIITGYRIGKLRKSSKDVILSHNGVYVAGEFHSWSGFSSKLVDISFIPADQDKTALISGSYQVLGAYRSNTGFFNLPVPDEHHDAAREAVRIIAETNRKAQRG